MREPTNENTGAFKTSIKITSNLHVSSMEPPSNLHQSDCMREPTNINTGVFKTSMKPYQTSMYPPWNLHQNSINYTI